MIRKMGADSVRGGAGWQTGQTFASSGTGAPHFPQMNSRAIPLKMERGAAGKSKPLFRHGLDQLGVVPFEEILHAGNIHQLDGNPLLVLQLEVFEVGQNFADLDDVDMLFAHSPELTGLQGLEFGQFLHFHLLKTGEWLRVFILTNLAFRRALWRSTPDFYKGSVIFGKSWSG